MYADHIEVYFVESMERIHGAGEAHIDYRHIIRSLVRKPGAFARYRFREQMMLLVCWLWDEESFQGRIGVRQTGGSLVMQGRLIARVAAPTPKRARTVAWANQARILQGRATPACPATRAGGSSTPATTPTGDRFWSATSPSR